MTVLAVNVLCVASVVVSDVVVMCSIGGSLVVSDVVFYLFFLFLEHKVCWSGSEFWFSNVLVSAVLGSQEKKNVIYINLSRSAGIAGTSPSTIL